MFMFKIGNVRKISDVARIMLFEHWKLHRCNIGK